MATGMVLTAIPPTDPSIPIDAPMPIDPPMPMRVSIAHACGVGGAAGGGGSRLSDGPGVKSLLGAQNKRAGCVQRLGSEAKVHGVPCLPATD